MNEKIAEPLTPVPIPEQVAAKEGHADLPGTRLWYWDTGGAGTPVVLLHPATGSTLIWLYQQPVFARAGYRVIAYSRRGHYNSPAASPEDPGIGSVDLKNLMEFLGVKKFHAVSSAAGGSVATDFAFSYPEKLFSLTVSSNNLAARNGYIADAAESIRPEEEKDLPRWVRELGPSYRAANPQGVKRWIELERESRHKGALSLPKTTNRITYEALGRIAAPTLLLTGDADLYMPPPVLRLLAEKIPGAKSVVVPECGHSAYWEQPDAFNRAVLDFLTAVDAGRWPKRNPASLSASAILPATEKK